MMTTLYRELTNVESPLSYSEKDVSDEQRGTLADISAELVNTQKRKIFERHAVEHPVTQSVIEGARAFYKLGEPIVEHCKSIEDAVAHKSFAYVSKDRILGIDPRDNGQVREVVDYLRNEGIINPAEFFSSQIVVPQVVSRAARRVEKFFERNILKAVFTVGGGSFAIGVYAGCDPIIQITNHERLNQNVNMCIGMFGSYFALWSPIFLASHLNGVSKLTKQRQKFKRALHYLDNEARQLFSMREKVVA